MGEYTDKQWAEIEKKYYSKNVKQSDLQKYYGLKGPIYKSLPPTKSGNFCPHCGAEMVFIKVSKRAYKYRDGHHIEVCSECGHCDELCHPGAFCDSAYSIYDLDWFSSFNKVYKRLGCDLLCKYCYSDAVKSLREKYIKDYVYPLKPVSKITLVEKLYLSFFLENSTSKMVKDVDGKEYIEYSPCVNFPFNVLQFLYSHHLICCSWMNSENVVVSIPSETNEAEFCFLPDSACLLNVEPTGFSSSFHFFDLDNTDFRFVFLDVASKAFSDYFVKNMIELYGFHSFEFDKCKLDNTIRTYFSFFSFAYILGALELILEMYPRYENKIFSYVSDDPYKSFQFWFEKMLKQVLNSKKVSPFYSSDLYNDSFFAFMLNHINFTGCSLFDIIWENFSLNSYATSSVNSSDSFVNIMKLLKRIDKKIDILSKGMTK